jgi:hypothetical protein
MPSVNTETPVSATPPPPAEHHDNAEILSDVASIASVGLTLAAALAFSPEIMFLAVGGAALAAGSKLYSSRHRAR